jgi:hypothetical protein
VDATHRQIEVTSQHGNDICRPSPYFVRLIDPRDIVGARRNRANCIRINR